MKKMDYSKYDVLGNSIYEFFVRDSALHFYDNMLTEDNLDLLKDFLEANLFSYMYKLGSYDMKESVYRINLGLKGYPLNQIDSVDFFDADYDLKTENVYLMTSIDTGIIADLYQEEFIAAEIIDEINNMADLIKAEYILMVKENEWLSSRVKEKLCLKIKLVDIQVGAPDEYPLFSDVEIGEDAIETLLSFNDSNRTYYKKYLTEEGGKTDHTVNMFSSNGSYTGDSNGVVLTFGTIQSLINSKDCSFEEKLGIFGNTLSHEIAHAISPDFIELGVDGIYMDYITEEEDEIIWNSFNNLSLVIDNMETNSGNHYTGSQTANELFTDILSLDCSLRLLEKKENANYDAFFVNCARGLAIEMTPAYEEHVLRLDNHVLGRERINLLFYQFDKFYETYEIDTNDKWYVKPDNRITGYK